MYRYLILPAVAFLINFFTMAYASALNIKNPLNRSYVLLSAFISFWIICSAAFYLPVEDSFVVPFSRFSSLFWFFTGFLYTNFTYALLRRRRDLFYFLILSTAIVLFAISLTTDLIVSGFSRYPWGWRFSEGRLFTLASVSTIILPIGVSWVMALIRLRGIHDEEQRKQITLLLAGTFVSILAAGVNQYLLPNIPGFENVVRYMSAWSVIMTSSVFYIIIRHRFLAPELKDFAAELFASAREGVVVLNESGTVLHINDPAKEILNIGYAEPSSLRIEGLIEGYRPDMGYSNFRTTTGDKETKRTILVSQSEMRDGKTRIGRILIINDISEMAKMNEALRESNELFKLITGNVADIIWIFDLSTFRFSYVSPSVTSILGWTPEEFTGTSLAGLISEKDLKRITGYIEDELANDSLREPSRSKSIRLLEQTRSGRLVDVEIRASAIRDAEGKPVAILGVTRDITEQKRLENELQSSLRQLRERNDAIENDLQTAQKIQRALLPLKAPQSEHLAIDFRYNPLETVGGDFFNIQPLSEGGLSVFQCDVTGHGITAALFLSLLRLISNTHMRRYAYEPSAFMSAINTDLFENMQSYFVTAVYGVFKYDAGDNSVKLSASCGGHPAPVIHRSGEQSAMYLDIHGKMIGLLGNTEYSSREIRLHPGDRVYFYTDGLPEISNASHEYMGFDRFLQVIGRTWSMEMGHALDAIISAANDFRGSEPIADDILIIGVEVR